MFAWNTAPAQQTIQISDSHSAEALYSVAEALLESGHAQQAYEMLAAEESTQTGNAYFDYLLGVAALDSGQYSAAILALERSVANAPDFSGARLELARALYDSGDPGSARPLFQRLLQEMPPPEVRTVIDQYLVAIDATPPTPAKQFLPYAELFAGHDSNANGSTSDQQFMGFTLAPDNVETESPFIEAAAGFHWYVPTSPRVTGYLGARIAYRDNPDASFVDSGVLSGLGGFMWQSGNNYGRAGLQAYTASRDGSSNENYTGVDVTIGRHLNELWDIHLGVRSGALRYDDAIEVLDVNRTLATLGTTYRFSPRAQFRLEAIAGSDSEQQTGSPYGNDKVGARASVTAPMGEQSYWTASIGSLQSDYDGLFFGASREDTQLTSLLQLEFRNVWTRGLTIAPRLRYIDNDSDVSLYDYDRLEMGIQIRWAP